jgi:hypothetical protein
MAICVGLLASYVATSQDKLNDKSIPIWIVTGNNRDSYIWKTRIGSHSSTPIASENRIFVGTNNAEPRDPSVMSDQGVLMCFSRKDGRFQWQRTHARLTHRANDVPNTSLVR